LLSLLVAAGIGLSLWGREIRSGSFLIGDCPYYASAAVSLLVDGDLDLKNQLKGGLEVHQRQVALGLHGEWYPKHPILMSALSVPFYAGLGVAGFLLFNLLVVGCLAGVIWALCRRHVTPALATLSTAILLAGTFLRAYVYNYSPDLFAAVLFLGGLWLVLRERPLGGGLFLGLAVLAKITNLFALLIVAAFACCRHDRRQALRLAAGALPPLLLLALFNSLMFGSPTTTGYDRTLVLAQGEAVTVSHRGFFDLPISEGVWGQLFSARTGLLPTAPALLLAVPGFFILLRRRPWEGLLVLCLCEFIFLLFSTYRWWATSHYGNRFLMVPVALSAIPLSLTLDWARLALGRRRGSPALLVPTVSGGK
jgi:hypothetical protein